MEEEAKAVYAQIRERDMNKTVDVSSFHTENEEPEASEQSHENDIQEDEEEPEEEEEEEPEEEEPEDEEEHEEEEPEEEGEPEDDDAEPEEEEVEPEGNSSDYSFKPYEFRERRAVVGMVGYISLPPPSTS